MLEGTSVPLLLLSKALQLLVQSFGLPKQFLPSSSILDKGLPVWHFGLCPFIHPTFLD